MADEKIIIDVTAALSDIAKLKGGMVDLQAQAAKTGSAITASIAVSSKPNFAKSSRFMITFHYAFCKWSLHLCLPPSR